MFLRPTPWLSISGHLEEIDALNEETNSQIACAQLITRILLRRHRSARAQIIGIRGRPMRWPATAKGTHQR